ncbi:DUF6463 family protein [Pseudonocardia sp. TRM90224]|uniref:DUF6463 family protein n=1 Tax=Pseudonocardia sp. TRM90224 TaxID=2812678 RepID=UPI001E4DE918|nr:DUF6463 family protein [Pseudonocardia sp. TRM90224]
MSRLTRALPWMIIGLGVFHLGYVVAESPGIVGAIIADGLAGASNTVERDFVTWFFIGGLALLFFGMTAQWHVRNRGELPAHVGWWLLGIGAFDTALEPDGGGWIMLALGLLAVFDLRRNRRRAAADQY